jgi:hypothetical protein
MENDVAAVAGDRRANPRIQQLLDLVDNLLILRRHVLFGRGRGGVHSGTAGDKVLHEGPKNLGLKLLPAFVLRLGHGDEVGAEEDAGDARKREECARQGAAPGGLPRGEVRSGGAHHVAAGEELERRGVWGAFGLDEHEMSACS